MLGESVVKGVGMVEETCGMVFAGPSVRIQLDNQQTPRLCRDIPRRLFTTSAMALKSNNNSCPWTRTCNWLLRPLETSRTCDVCLIVLIYTMANVFKIATAPPTSTLPTPHPAFIERMSHMPLISSIGNAYEATKKVSRVVKVCCFYALYKCSWQLTRGKK